MAPIRATVLVVEDDPGTRGLIQDVLELAGYSVETAPNGAVAREFLAAGGIEIVVLDQMLPLVHGLELCRLIRGKRSDVYLPIIMVTALGGDTHQHNAFAAGADVYLTKPFDVDELLYVVDRWASICQRQKEKRAGPAALAPEDRLSLLGVWDRARQAVLGVSRYGL